MNKQRRSQLITEAQESFQQYLATTTDKPKDRTNECVVEYMSLVIKSLPNDLIEPEVGTLVSGTMVLTWQVQDGLIYNSATLYIYDTGRMHLCMNCGEFAGQILGRTMDHLGDTIKAFMDRLKPYFSK